MKRIRAWTRLVTGLGCALLASQAQASGSWVATAPSVQVVMPDRPVQSADLAPPTAGLAIGQVVGRVSWQFTPPAGGEVDARLCHVGGCVVLAGPRGHTEALAGIPADSVLYFQFALQDSRQRAMTLQGLQVIVNHHPGPSLNQARPVERIRTL
ncbi:flagellar protein FlhE [Billgrantia montanilacus]|uniref:Flagellar FlhE n=1 Tax=Billgrantia montanilacus TaxID=2282305 RepID=A0A368U459_9GAMM|nr:flagellar FlhE [Halomonas montanilacus]